MPVFGVVDMFPAVVLGQGAILGNRGAVESGGDRKHRAGDARGFDGNSGGREDLVDDHVGNLQKITGPLKQEDVARVLAEAALENKDWTDYINQKKTRAKEYNRRW